MADLEEEPVRFCSCFIPVTPNRSIFAKVIHSVRAGKGSHIVGSGPRLPFPGEVLHKLGMFGRIRRKSDEFLRIFRATRSVANPQALVMVPSPFANVYAAGYRELQSQVGGVSTNPHPPRLKSLQAVTVSMHLASAEEVRRVEKGMSWLATTGAVSPFIGLFGTVWGIIDAFSGLGSAGAASLRAVAPGIAEALVTTAAGLFAAIPAVIFYNHFLQNIRDLAQRLDTFALEVTSLIEKAMN